MRYQSRLVVILTLAVIATVLLTGCTATKTTVSPKRVGTPVMQMTVYPKSAARFPRSSSQLFRSLERVNPPLRRPGIILGAVGFSPNVDKAHAFSGAPPQVDPKTRQANCWVKVRMVRPICGAKADQTYTLRFQRWGYTMTDPHAVIMGYDRGAIERAVFEMGDKLLVYAKRDADSGYTMYGDLAFLDSYHDQIVQKVVDLVRLDAMTTTDKFNSIQKDIQQHRADNEMMQTYVECAKKLGKRKEAFAVLSADAKTPPPAGTDPEEMGRDLRQSNAMTAVCTLSCDGGSVAMTGKAADLFNGIMCDNTVTPEIRSSAIDQIAQLGGHIGAQSGVRRKIDKALVHFTQTEPNTKLKCAAKEALSNMRAGRYGVQRCEISIEE